MNWGNVELVIIGLSAFIGAFVVALWISLVIWTFRDMRARSRDAFAQLLAALLMLVLGPVGIILYLLLRPRETLAEKYERSLEEEALLQDIEERQICPGCKQPIDTDYMLCPICHTRLRQPCVQCERLIHPRWAVCPYCATSQKPVPGIEEAGRVTLQDLEPGELADVPALEPPFEPPFAASLEPPAAAGLEAEEEPIPDEGFEPIPESNWEPIGTEQEPEPEPEDNAELSDLFSSPDAEPYAQPPEADESDETDQADNEATDETPRRPLSLFRRS
jgi:RNA polymerase subunit RPABC4/transcription elongation factor Spt4